MPDKPDIGTPVGTLASTSVNTSGRKLASMSAGTRESASERVPAGGSASAFSGSGALAGSLARAPVRSLFKRPESVLVVVYTLDLDVLLICRQQPAGFWQSVTGSLEAGETPLIAAQRELAEETGITQAVIDHGTSRTYRIKPAWRKRYAPNVTDNCEHEFSVQLATQVPVVLDPAEHTDYCWLPIVEAIAKVGSHSNRAALRLILNAEG